MDWTVLTQRWTLTLWKWSPIRNTIQTHVTSITILRSLNWPDLQITRTSSSPFVCQWMASTMASWMGSDSVLPDGEEPICVGVWKFRFSGFSWSQTRLAVRETRGFQPSPIKLIVRLPIIDISTCSRAYRPSRLILGQGQVCAGGKKSEDTCPGDSGSPLMYFHPKLGKWVASGVVSLGLNECGTDGIPGVYTRVDTYLPWILSTIEADWRHSHPISGLMNSSSSILTPYPFFIVLSGLLLTFFAGVYVIVLNTPN